jgi:hypothetical protein
MDATFAEGRTLRFQAQASKAGIATRHYRWEDGEAGLLTNMCIRGRRPKGKDIFPWFHKMMTIGAAVPSADRVYFTAKEDDP